MAIRASAMRSRLPPRLTIGLPNAVARQAALDRQLEGDLGLADQPHAVVHASGPEPALGDLEGAALAEQDVLLRHPHLVEADLAVADRLVVRRSWSESSRSTFTPGVSRGTSTIVCRWCRSASGSESPMNTRILQSGCPTPVDHHLRPLMTTSSPSTTAVASMLVASEEATPGLGHRERRADLPVEQRLEPLRLLLVGAVLEQHLHVAGVGRVAVEDVRREEGRPAHLLGQRRVVGVASARRRRGCRTARRSARRARPAGRGSTGPGRGPCRAARPGSATRPTRRVAAASLTWRWYSAATGSISSRTNAVTSSRSSAARG